jgi:tetratricopeptide (TPR) repeat protein
MTSMDKPGALLPRLVTTVLAAGLMALAGAGCAIHTDRRPQPQVAVPLIDEARLAAAQERWEDALQAYERGLFLDPGRAVAVHAEHARVLCAVHREDDAHELLTRGLSLHPNDPSLLALRAELSGRLGFHRAAERDLEILTKLEPLDAPHWRNLGAVRLHLDLPRSSLMPLRRACELEPSHLEGRFLLGRALTEAGECDEAAETIRTCILRSGGAQHAPGVWLKAGAEAVARGATTLAAPDLLREALEWVEVLMSRAPGNSSLFRTAGMLFDRAGDPGAAIAAFERAVELEPRDAASSDRLLQLYLRNGNPLKAIALAQRALELGPDEVRRGKLLALVERAPQ